MNLSFMAYLIYFIFYAVIHTTFDVSYLHFMKKFYAKNLARIQNKDVENLKPFRVWPAGAFAYAIILIGFWVFVIHDIINGIERRKWVIFLKSTLLALCIWGMYNLTNYVFLEKYKAKMGYIDTAWGIVSCNIIAFLFLFLVEYFSRVSSKNSKK